MMMFIFQLNWNQREDSIERTVLKSFLVDYIHVEVKVSFCCIKLKMKLLHWFWLPIFVPSLVSLLKQNQGENLFRE
jgi:hypothetical protein